MRPNNIGGDRGRGLPGPGPLMTNHLKVRDLDRELAVLRRRREMIQREQQMLSLECETDRKRQYPQTNRNVSNMYGNVWRANPPKRIYVPQEVKSWRNASQDLFMPKPMPQNYIPSLMDNYNMPRAPMISNATILTPVVRQNLHDGVDSRMQKPSQALRKDYRPPSKVVKKKPQAPPNKLNSYPEKERKDLVLKSLHNPLTAITKANNTTPESTDAMILREDQIPIQRVTGRLELALGNIVKEIKLSNEQNVEFTELLSKIGHQRIVKNVVRERIRTVMLNQPVNSVVEIVKRYREKFPKESDKDIVDLVTNSGPQTAETVVETENPEEYFKNNVCFILERKIQEMFINLHKMYTYRCTMSPKAAIIASMKPDESVEEDKALNDAQAMKVLRNITAKYVTVEERNTLNKYYSNLIEDIIEDKIVNYLPKCKDQLFKIFKLDYRMRSVKFLPYEGDATEDEPNVDNEEMQEESITDGNKVEDKEANKNNEIVPDTITENNETHIQIIQKDGMATSIEEKVCDDNNTTQIGTAVTKKNTSALPVQTKEKEAPSTPKPARLVSNETVLSAPIKPTTPTTKMVESDSPFKTQTSSPSPKELPYYIKLIGRPNLPTRPVICEFLNSYQPTSIKKHKSINNLLVVGFRNQDDYNKILAANETTIGDITIIIKTGERVIPGKENDSPKESPVVQKEVSDVTLTETPIDDRVEKDRQLEKSPLKEVINSDNAQKEVEASDLNGTELNNQSITDPLSTIKETEEDVTESCNPGDNNKTSLQTNNVSSQKPTDSGKSTHETVKETEVEVKSGDNNDTDKIKGSKVKESGRATPVRNSSRLANVTPSTIRTRRASRLMQE